MVFIYKEEIKDLYRCVIKDIAEKHNYKSDVYKNCKNCSGYGVYTLLNSILECEYYTPLHLYREITKFHSNR